MPVPPGLNLQYKVCDMVCLNNLIFVSELKHLYSSSVLCMTNVKKLFCATTSEKKFPKFLHCFALRTVLALLSVFVFFSRKVAGCTL